MKPGACALLAAALALPLHAADILEADYNAARDQIEVDIAYRGTHPDHEFTVQWGECSGESPPRLVGRLVDRHGGDAAREDYRTTERVPLGAMPCRPAIVTLRLGRVAHAEVFVPRHIELMRGAPQRPYEEIGAIEARGRPGEQLGFVRQELRNKARALGADAVIRVDEQSAFHGVPGREEQPDLLGNAYPGPVYRVDPGSVPAHGFEMQTGGRYYELRGVAVRFTETEQR
jgi:hypothetical protein